MNKTIKIKFADFWGGDFIPEDNFIINTLKPYYDCVLSDEPDYLFFSTFGSENLKYDCVKIQFIGENISPDFNNCDYAMAFDWIQYEDRYLRLPLYQVRDNFKDFPRVKVIDPEKVLNRKFCSLVVSNLKNASPMREKFFRLLSEYKQVDSGGRLWNNVGGPVKDKGEFISNYKFNIAFENSKVHGYTTEKIMDPMVVNSIPIYWGNPAIGREFNPKAFVNVDDFSSLEQAVEHIVKLDTDDDLYLQMLNEPWTISDSIFDWQESLTAFLKNIIDKPLQEAKYISPYGMQKAHKTDLEYLAFAHRYLKINKISAARNAVNNILKKNSK